MKQVISLSKEQQIFFLFILKSEDFFIMTSVCILWVFLTFFECEFAEGKLQFYWEIFFLILGIIK